MDVMIDFESFGTGPNACLSQVGAVFFDNRTGELGDEFKVNIDARTHVAKGGIIDADTVYWWLKQSREAQDSVLAPGEDITSAMIKLDSFLSPATRVWSHATFDFVLYQNTMKSLGLKPSVGYRSGMDLRTLTYLGGISVSDFKREGIHHDGLADAKFQVKYCVAALNAIRGNKSVVGFLEKMLR